MAEVKNNFLKSKMNKDLDDRLVPVGEYRHAQNITVAKSEGQDVGALENILGNDLVSDFILSRYAGAQKVITGVEIIGHYMDIRNDRIIIFMTNYVDTSSDTLSNHATNVPSAGSSYHVIGVYDLKTYTSVDVVSGSFLNFSKTHEIYNINIIDDLLFWTDGRNQPRKINLSQALADNSYYTTEDTISVAKYYPYQTINLIEDRIIRVIPIAPNGTGYSVGNNISTTNFSGSMAGAGLTINITSVTGGGTPTCVINNPGGNYTNGDVVTVNGGTTSHHLQIDAYTTSTMQDVVSDYLPDGTTDNIYRQPYDNTQDITWQGDPEYLKDKFVRFSYRFKFDDGEYSLMSPFTQACFIPKQDSYFTRYDDEKSYKNTEVDFMENKVNDITLLINSPNTVWSDVSQAMKITEVDILYKEAGQNVIKIVDTIKSDTFDLNTTPVLRYNYKSTKPWKTLPESEILRVYDQVPIRAFTQDMAGNRVIYGNFVDKHTPPLHINYSCDVSSKTIDGDPEKFNNNQIEYQNQNLKQNRSYQVGIILSDRYGRQSTVILSSLDENRASKLIKGSTIFHEYSKNGFSNSNLTGGSLLNPTFPGPFVWDGDELNLTFWDIISSTKSSITGEPGLYNETTNPLGWYSYKIVVKQTEQDYYNVYFPGILNGYIDGDTQGTAATSNDPTCHFVLHGDNINKIPRDLTLVGPNQTTFRSGRPSILEDPSYYKFSNTNNGIKFSADPKTEDGRRLLKQRDRDRDLNEGSQVTNSSVKLSLRLNNYNDLNFSSTLPWKGNSTKQAYPGNNIDTVVTIGTGKELGLWDSSAEMPYNTANVFYEFKNNPYVAKTSVSDPHNTGLIGPHPDSGRFNFYTRFFQTVGGVPLLQGTNYISESKNISCTLDLAAAPANSEQIGGAGSGFQVNIDEADGTTGKVESFSIAYPGTGWNVLGPDQAASYSTEGISSKITGAGDGNAEFVLHYTKTSYAGEMIPSLSVYETEPLESKLDIYWETSTSGLISELNTNILYNNTTVPISFGDFNSDPITSVGTEATIIGDDITGNIFVLDGVGTVLNSGPNTFTLLSVIDGYGDNRTNEFEIGAASTPYGVIPYGFRIKLKEVQVCNSDFNIKESFIFNISVQVPSENYAIDGSFINKTLALGPIVINNIVPSFVLPPDPTVSLTGSINGGLIHTFNAVNGSVVGGGKETEDITFTLTDPSGELYLDYSTNIAGQVQLSSRSNGTAGSYPITLEVFDGGGLSDSYVNTVTLS
jgi:hypothetical protein